jgi:hypothetical protein
MINILKHLGLLLLYHLHLYTFPVNDVYVSYLLGQIPQSWLFKYIRLNQVEDFKAYHRKVVELFELMPHQLKDGQTIQEAANEAAERVKDFITQNPDLRLLLQQLKLHMKNEQARSKTLFTLTQINNVIERLEIEVLRARGDINHVGRID